MCAGKGYVAPSGLSNRDIKLFAVRDSREISAQSRRGGPRLFPENAISVIGAGARKTYDAAAASYLW